MRTINYLKKTKEVLDVSSDYGLAKKLGLTKQTISGYMNGNRTMDDYTAAKLAEVLGISALEVIAAANAEREKDAEKAEFWRKLAKMSAAAIAIPLIVMGGEKQEISLNNSNMHYAQWMLSVLLFALVVIWRKHEEENRV